MDFIATQNNDKNEPEDREKLEMENELDMILRRKQKRE